MRLEVRSAGSRDTVLADESGAFGPKPTPLQTQGQGVDIVGSDGSPAFGG